VDFPFLVTFQKNISFLVIMGVLLSLLKYIRIVLLEPKIWFFISMMTFCICTGGVVYGMIHNAPWFKFEKDEFGQNYVSEYFMKGQTGQWSGEGYIVSTLTACTGFTLIAISRANSLFKGAFQKRVGLFVLVIGAYILTQMILTCYKYKSPWYGPGFTAPGHYLKGPLSVD
jgi:hypothetical protein